MEQKLEQGLEQKLEQGLEQGLEEWSEEWLEEWLEEGSQSFEVGAARTDLFRPQRPRILDSSQIVCKEILSKRKQEVVISC